MSLIVCEAQHPLADKPLHGFSLPDVRHDPLVGHMLARLWDLVNRHPLRDAHGCGIVALTRTGCAAHVERVSEGIAQDKARHAFFVRAGPQMMATYAAMALKSHGPAFTLMHAGHAAPAHTIVQGLMRLALAPQLIVLGGDCVQGHAHTFACLLSKSEDGRWPNLAMETLASWMSWPSDISERSSMYAIRR